jgi:hypothetical protein
MADVPVDLNEVLTGAGEPRRGTGGTTATDGNSPTRNSARQASTRSETSRVNRSRTCSGRAVSGHVLGQRGPEGAGEPRTVLPARYYRESLHPVLGRSGGPRHRLADRRRSEPRRTPVGNATRDCDTGRCAGSPAVSRPARPESLILKSYRNRPGHTDGTDTNSLILMALIPTLGDDRRGRRCRSRAGPSA